MFSATKATKYVMEFKTALSASIYEEYYIEFLWFLVIRVFAKQNDIFELVWLA